MQQENYIAVRVADFEHKEFNKLLVRNILEYPTKFHWSVQGLGMMRVYLSRAVRLHVWDSELKIPGVSALHTHPWDMKSYVIAGRYKQHRYTKGYNGETFNEATIQCGENAHVIGDPVRVGLVEHDLEVYAEGDRYKQAASEIHLSLPEDGTVTIVERVFKKDTEHANVYWRGTGPWVDAQPRPATETEVQDITRRSLNKWFDDIT
jgi:hypothetical protein